MNPDAQWHVFQASTFAAKTFAAAAFVLEELSSSYGFDERTADCITRELKPALAMLYAGAASCRRVLPHLDSFATVAFAGQQEAQPRALDGTLLPLLRSHRQMVHGMSIAPGWAVPLWFLQHSPHSTLPRSQSPCA
jgi:hypothetical protein